MRCEKIVEVIPVPPPAVWDAIGTYWERSRTRTSCNLVITETLKWLRRGESNCTSPFALCKLLILGSNRTIKIHTIMECGPVLDPE